MLLIVVVLIVTSCLGFVVRFWMRVLVVSLGLEGFDLW